MCCWQKASTCLPSLQLFTRSAVEQKTTAQVRMGVLLYNNPMHAQTPLPTLGTSQTAKWLLVLTARVQDFPGCIVSCTTTDTWSDIYTFSHNLWYYLLVSCWHLYFCSRKLGLERCGKLFSVICRAYILVSTSIDTECRATSYCASLFTPDSRCFPLTHIVFVLSAWKS